MKLWLLKRKDPHHDGFTEMVVAAHTEDEAVAIHPDGPTGAQNTHGRWVRSPEDLVVTWLGEAADGIEAGVISSDFWS